MASSAPGRLEALGDERTVVEQAGGLAERREIELDALAAQRLQMGERPVEHIGGVDVAEEFQRGARGHAEAKARRARPRLEADGVRLGTRRRIVRVVPAGDVRDGGASSTVSAKTDTQSSERQAGTTPRRAEQAPARLQARRCC